MKSIFNPADNAELINRINNLTAHTPAIWGEMNAAQMLAHCRAGIDMAFGNIPVKRHWVGWVFGNISKKRLLKVAELDRYIPTFELFKITDLKDFDEEKEKLIALLKSALTKGASGLAKYPHPYFATFKNDEWARLYWKHMDHHLRQFGV